MLEQEAQITAELVYRMCALYMSIPKKTDIKREDFQNMRI